MRNLQPILEQPRISDEIIEKLVNHQGGVVTVKPWETINMAMDLAEARAALRERMRFWWLMPCTVLIGISYAIWAAVLLHQCRHG